MPSDSSPTVTQLPNTFQQVPTLTSGQQGTLDQLTSILQGQIGQGAPGYSGALPGSQGASGLQQGNFDLITSMLNGSNPGQANINQTLTTQMAPWDKSTATDWWNQAVVAPSMDTWNNQIAPDIMEQFAAMDAVGGGGARKALSEAGASMNTQMSGQLATALLQDKNNAATNALKAAGLEMGNLSDLSSLSSNAGATQYGITQNQLSAPYNEFLRTLPANNPWLKYLSPALDAKAFQNMPANSDPIFFRGQQSSLPGMIGGAGSLLGGVGGLLGAFF